MKNTAYALDLPIKINHFRTRGGLEVDFIVTLSDRIFAIELKSSDPAPSELTPLKSLQQYIRGPLQKYVACIDCIPKKVDDIEILPWQTVLGKIFTVASSSQ